MAADPTSTPEWEVLPEDATKTTEVASEEQVSLPVEESRNDIASESADAAIDSFIEKSQAAEEEPLLETDTEVIDSTKCQNPGDLAGFVGFVCTFERNRPGPVKYTENASWPAPR